MQIYLGITFHNDSSYIFKLKVSQSRIQDSNKYLPKAFFVRGLCPPIGRPKSAKKIEIDI